MVQTVFRADELCSKYGFWCIEAFFFEELKIWLEKIYILKWFISVGCLIWLHGIRPINGPYLKSFSISPGHQSTRFSSCLLLVFYRIQDADFAYAFWKQEYKQIIKYWVYILMRRASIDLAQKIITDSCVLALVQVATGRRFLSEWNWDSFLSSNLLNNAPFSRRFPFHLRDVARLCCEPVLWIFLLPGRTATEFR
jgi:hypothetical protein